MKLFCNFYLRGWLWKKDLKEKSLVLIFEIAMEEKISIPIRSRIFCFFFSGRVGYNFFRRVGGTSYPIPQLNSLKSSLIRRCILFAQGLV